jgi:hypothetical protein
MKLAVVGSRGFGAVDRIKPILNKIRMTCGQDLIVVSGKCEEGPDRIAEEWAAEHGLLTEIYPADWDAFGDAAGPKRNQKIIDAADHLVAFWYGASPGTVDAINRARRKKGMKVEVFLG